jgi:uncharacterized protein RhaS with RHS repeats
MIVGLSDTTRHPSRRDWTAHRVDHSRCPLHCRRRVKSASRVHRYYDPVTSQFLSVDPLVDSTGTPYAFTGGDPVNGSDPSGLCDSNPFSGGFWSGGNCLSRLVGGPDGGGGENVGGVVKSVAGLAGGVAASVTVGAEASIATGVTAASDIVVEGGAYADTISTIDSATTEASQLAGKVTQVSGLTISGFDCLSRTIGTATCLWDVLSTGLGSLLGKWPGGLPGAVLSFLTLAPSPFEASDCKTS